MNPDPAASATRSLHLSDTPGSNDASAAFLNGYRPGAHIGPYELLQLIGEGGMGQVWLAEQHQPVQRRVALKLIKAGMDTREVVIRFASERQALALMDHPAIATVFDAGSTPEGRPYFVMEYVAGVPITDYCDQYRLSIRQRIELFILVCEAVQHAHQKAIIHRDLKPSNILVAEVDGKPMPRIIDFGLAKAMSQRPADGTLYTRAGTVVGTMGYMSPEQAGGSDDIDTRTDVYSLGVVLYELLVGVLPLDLRNLGDLEALQRLRDEDSPRPSSKLRTLGPGSSIAARNRASELPVLTRQLRRDVDWIALRALEKDRKRRYATPLELAADLRHYLRNEPVSAHPPSVAYRAGKYVRRHRLGVAVAASGVILLAGFAVAQSFELRSIRRQRDRADRITAFMIGMFRMPSPSAAKGNVITAREILDHASRQIGAGLSGDPELQAQLMETMAQTYSGLGLYPRAQELTRQALAIQQPLLGPRNRATLATESDLARLQQAQGHSAQAEQSLRRILAVQRRVLGPDDPDTLATMDRLAYAISNQGRNAEAEALFRQTLAAERRVLGPENPQTLGTLNVLAETLTPQGQFAEADRLYAELIAAQQRTLGSDDPATLLSMSHAAENLTEEGRYPDAEKLYTQVIAAQRRVLGPDHPQTLRAMSNLGVVLLSEGRYAEADRLETQVIATRTRVLGPTHASTLQSMESEAACLIREGKYNEGVKMFEEIIASGEKTSQPMIVAETWYNFACEEARLRHFDLAFADLDHALSSGPISPALIAADPLLQPLHSDPRFAALLKKAARGGGG